MDEVTSNINRENSPYVANWEELRTDTRNTDFLIALSPGGSGKTRKYTVRPPSGPNILSRQLLVRHRNSYEISLFLEFLKHTNFANCHLDDDKDKELERQTLPRGRLPVWVEKGYKTSDIEALKLIKRDHIFDHESVTLIHPQKNPDKARDTEETRKIRELPFMTSALLGLGKVVKLRELRKGDV